MESIVDKFSHCPVCGGRFRSNSAKSLRCDDCGFELFANPAAAVVAVIRNRRGDILVTRRALEPAKGTLDLPGGFCDMNETVEQAVAREVKEETGLEVESSDYLFSLPNVYRYSGVDIPTLDFFFSCTVSDCGEVRAMDDAADCMWVAKEDLHPEDFGLKSIRQGVQMIIENL